MLSIHIENIWKTLYKYSVDDVHTLYRIQSYAWTYTKTSLLTKEIKRKSYLVAGDG